MLTAIISFFGFASFCFLMFVLARPQERKVAVRVPASWAKLEALETRDSKSETHPDWY